MNVAQPNPYSPGSLVSTLTTTSRILAGEVRKVLMSVIRSGGVPRAASSAIVAGLSSAPNVLRANQGGRSIHCPSTKF